ncbi:MAG: hypothetical protein N4A72_22060 [Bacteroidales bacterium]|jgi:hypothetical protein|nr:hypothetical protein [Bacteroidales bacterium]
MDKLYTKIVDTLDENKAFFIKKGCTPIQHIDLYRGQPIAPDRFEIFNLPALFLEYAIDWQREVLTLSVHVLVDPVADSSSISPNRLQAMEIFSLYKLIKHFLNDLSSENTGKLKLTSERPVESDIINYQILEFECTIEREYYNTSHEEISIKDVKTRKRGAYQV